MRNHNNHHNHNNACQHCHKASRNNIAKQPTVTNIRDMFPDLPDNINGIAIKIPEGTNINDFDLDKLVNQVHAAAQVDPATQYHDNEQPKTPCERIEEYCDDEDINQLIAEGDRYIHPALLEARDALEGGPYTEADLDLRRMQKIQRGNNALIAQLLAEDMAATYRRHVATLLEYNTQCFNAHLQNTKDVLYRLINEDDND